ncbi:DMT family transporter [Vibrio sp. 10N]|uniref:DMT family transporter n=1 Tax=Vibrio sp. 10N TaxID=3058938 RepID=UPI0028130567|nr:DMT family transporter [Vibrio sp. 10N]
MNSTVTLSFAAMTAFAFNSLLCRLALGSDAIDPVSFTSIRLVSGAATLIVLSTLIARRQIPQTLSASIPLKQSLALGATLFGYALLFSLAYITLDTGTGALILFGTVQFALIIHHRLTGHTLTPLEMLGMFVAVGGFILLLLPGAAQPSWLGASLMLASGLCWSGFTLLGKQVSSPILATKQGFIVASVMVLALAIFSQVLFTSPSTFSVSGILYALLSGVIASGLGYYLWYRLLPSIDVLQASLMQLSVPAIAMFLGWGLLAEAPSYLSLLATALILSGIALTTWAKSRSAVEVTK